MTSYVETSKADFLLSPSERKQRQEILQAISTVQSAIDLLARKQEQDSLATDLQSRQLVSSSQKCIVKLQSYVEQTLS